MSDKPVNTREGGDGILLVVFLLLVVLPDLVKRLDVTVPRGTPEHRWTGIAFLAFLAAILLLYLVHKLIYVKACLSSNPKYHAIRAAAMAPIGAMAISFLGLVVWMALFMLGIVVLSWPLPAPVSGAMLVLGIAVVPGWWSGWRFGKWGFFWGGLGALLMNLRIVAQSEDLAILSHVELLYVVGCILAGAIAGELGARRFQRSAKASHRPT